MKDLGATEKFLDTSEIFDKARVYAERAPVKNNRYEMMEFMFSAMHDGEKRLHAQAMKVLDKAIYMALDNDAVYKDDASFKAAVSKSIDAMQEKYAAGWTIEKGDNNEVWCYKDFKSSDPLIETLGFLRRMGVVYTRQDRNPLSDAIHLKVSPDDFGIIFHPSTYNGREGAKGI